MQMHMKTKWIMTAVASLAIVLRAIFPDHIDPVTLIVVGFVVLAWSSDIIRRIDLPGGVGIEYRRDLEPIANQVEKTGLVADVRSARPRTRHVYAFESVARGDPGLTLMGLRDELDDRIRKIAKSRSIAINNEDIVTLIMRLIQEGVLSGDEASGLHQLLPVLAKAERGVAVDSKVCDWVMTFGPRILDALEERMGETSIPALIGQWKNRDGEMHMDIGEKLSKALVRSPRAFLNAMKDDMESFDSWLDTLGTNTFTLFQSQDEIDDNLYTAYYMELKRLMKEALEPLLTTELTNEASRVLSVVTDVEIRRIW